VRHERHLSPLPATVSIVSSFVFIEQRTKEGFIKLSAFKEKNNKLEKYLKKPH
jgi:hypothetical protein